MTTFIFRTQVILLLIAAVTAGIVTSTPAQAYDPDRPNTITLEPGFPLLANLVYSRRLTPAFEVGIGGIATPQISVPLNGGTAAFTYDNIQIVGRLFPLYGSWYIGVIGGYRVLSGSATQSVTVGAQAVPLNETITVTTLNLIPNMGWCWNIGGFAVGLELGYFLASVSTSQNTSVTNPALAGLLGAAEALPQYTTLSNSIQNAGNAVGNSGGIPIYAAIRLGWSF